MNNPGSVDSPVLPCEILDMEVVSDVIEDLDDIEVRAETKDEPEPDIDVTCSIIDEEEPAVTLTCTITESNG
jgi:hypothetical protein